MEVGQHSPVASGLSWVLEITTAKDTARSGKSQTTLEIFATSEEANSSSENIGIFLEFEDRKASTVK
ncbi:hypothetical protein HGM15179_000672 [Zosterops borbonicus]|uniref:Uncharacterized protein n=1 Tax=Zosterops borbonicus TaxID=364589 RepID=A0A8K1H0A4_9PASS|nr:hypothetical protein HGM15179_000672 [Zosterops borbonicus]